MAVLDKIHRRHKDLGFLMIAVWKLMRGVFLVGVALWASAGIYETSSEDATSHFFWRWVHWQHLAGSHQFVREFLVRHGIMQEGSMKWICLFSGVYSIKLFIEGFGLWFEKVWAPYLVVILTTAFIPVEIYKLAMQPTVPVQVALVLNFIVVGYLAFRLVQATMADKARQLKVLSRLKLFYSSVGGLAVISFLDYITGSEFFFFVFYVIPVALYAWYSNLAATVTAAFVCAVAWWFADWVGGHHYAHCWFGYWNAFVCFLSFSVFGFALNVVRRHEELQRQAARQYLDALEEIRLLKARLDALSPELPAGKKEDPSTTITFPQ